jgi:mono/diheme cytochrome c family protein
MPEPRRRLPNQAAGVHSTGLRAFVPGIARCLVALIFALALLLHSASAWAQNGGGSLARGREAYGVYCASCHGKKGKGDGPIVRGHEAYGVYCVSCHGEKGKGDGPIAESLNPRPTDFTDKKIMRAMTDDHIAEVIRRGGSDTRKCHLMPSWISVFSEGDVTDLVAFVRSLSH